MRQRATGAVLRRQRAGQRTDERQHARILRLREGVEHAVQRGGLASIVAESPEIEPRVPVGRRVAIQQTVDRRRVSQKREDNPQRGPAVRRRGVRVGRAQFGKRGLGIGREDGLEPGIVGVEGGHGIVELGLRHGARIDVIEHARVEDVRRDQDALQRRHVDRAQRVAVVAGRRRGQPRRPSLVLHIRLHADDRHRVTRRADAETRGEDAFKSLRQQGAERQIGGKVATGVDPEHQQRRRAEPVHVEVAEAVHDRVRPGAAADDVQFRHRDVAHDGAAADG